MGFQKGHKFAKGRPKGAINKSSDEIKDLLDSRVDFNLVVDRLYELTNGVTIKGEDGIYEKEPNHKAAELLLAYRYGKPHQRMDITSDDKPISTAPIIMKVYEQPDGETES